MQASVERNIKLYPWYQAATGFLPWMPVFFLFFSETVSLTEAITLGAIYYLSVVVFEIPSGYLSDRVGRRTTLMLAAGFAVCAYVVYLLAHSFQLLVVGQVLLAGAIAFQSGSDNSMLYDSLKVQRQTDHYTTHEARAQQYSMLSLAISVLLGGALGVINLRLPYFAALVAGLVALYISYSFKEPERIDNSEVKAFLPQLLSTARRVANPVLCWVFVFYVVGYALQHVPYEFYQPYIALLKSNAITAFFEDSNAAMVSGIVIGASMFGGALGARLSVPLAAKLGAQSVLLAGIAMQCMIIAGLGFWLHPALLILIMFRNFSMAMTHAPMHALIAPRVDSAQRATYLSMQSLAGRALFSAVLFTIAAKTGTGQQLNWPTLSWILQSCTLLGFIALLALTITAKLNPTLFANDS